MIAHRWVPVVALWFLLLAPSAHAFIDLPYITPAVPSAGETVSVNVRTGVCDAILNEREITRNGNAIRILFFGVRYFDSELCNLPVWTTTNSVGAYSPGSYTLQVDLVYGTVGGSFQTDTLGIVPFTVAGAPAQVVSAPVNQPTALLLLMLGIAAFGAWKLRARGVLGLLVVLVGASSSVRAQDAPPLPAIQVLLSTAPGAPTPDQLVSYYTRSPRSGTPLLQALAVGNPQAVQYLLPVRAEGDFLAWLRQNPASPRALLERYVVVFYPPDADIAPALTALRAD